MEISNELKSKIFGQYIGQECIYSNSFGRYKAPVEFGYHTQSHIESNAKIILKPISEISDEDAIEMAKIFGGIEGDVKINRPIYKQEDSDIYFIVQVFINEPKFYSYCVSKDWTDARVLPYQYLQSKGYDLPNYLLGGKTLKEAGLAIYKSNTKK